MLPIIDITHPSNFIVINHMSTMLIISSSDYAIIIIIIIMSLSCIVDCNVVFYEAYEYDMWIIMNEHYWCWIRNTIFQSYDDPIRTIKSYDDLMSAIKSYDDHIRIIENHMMIP